MPASPQPTDARRATLSTSASLRGGVARSACRGRCASDVASMKRTASAALISAATRPPGRGCRQRAARRGRAASAAPDRCWQAGMEAPARSSRARRARTRRRRARRRWPARRSAPRDRRGRRRPSAGSLARGRTTARASPGRSSRTAASPRAPVRAAVGGLASPSQPPTACHAKGSAMMNATSLHDELDQVDPHRRPHAPGGEIDRRPPRRRGGADRARPAGHGFERPATGPGAGPRGSRWCPSNRSTAGCGADAPVVAPLEEVAERPQVVLAAMRRMRGPTHRPSTTEPDRRRPDPPPRRQAVAIPVAGRADGRSGADVGGEDRREQHRRAEPPAGDEELAGPAHAPADAQAQADLGEAKTASSVRWVIQRPC